jgi:hypothetical protein
MWLLGSTDEMIRLCEVKCNVATPQIATTMLKVCVFSCSGGYDWNVGLDYAGGLG